MPPKIRAATLLAGSALALLADVSAAGSAPRRGTPPKAAKAPAEAAPAPASPPALTPPKPAVAPEKNTLALSLADAVFIGLRKNAAIRSAYVTRVAQLFALRVADDIFTPQAALAGSATRQTDVLGRNTDALDVAPTVQALTPAGTVFGFTWDNSVARSPGQKGSSSTANFTVAQPLLRGAGFDVNLAPVRSAHLADDANRLALRSTIIGAVTDTITAYRALQNSQDAKKLADDAVVRAQGLIDTDQALIAAGRLARTEIVQAQAQLEANRLAVLQSQNAIDTSRLALAVLLDLDLGTKLVARDRIDVKRTEVAVATALPIALANRPDYLSIQDALEQARLGITVAENQRLWNLSLVGSGTMGASTARLAGARPVATKIGSAAVGLQLSGPINSLVPEQAVVNARTSQQTLDIQFSQLKRSIEQTVRQAAAIIELDWQEVEASRRLATLAASAIDIEKQKLAVGRSTVFQVQSLEASYTGSLNAVLGAETTYANALTAFDQQLGTTLETWKVSIAGQ